MYCLKNDFRLRKFYGWILFLHFFGFLNLALLRYPSTTQTVYRSSVHTHSVCFVPTDGYRSISSLPTPSSQSLFMSTALSSCGASGKRGVVWDKKTSQRENHAKHTQHTAYTPRLGSRRTRIGETKPNKTKHTTQRLGPTRAASSLPLISNRSRVHSSICRIVSS